MRPVFQNFMLQPQPALYQFISYAFLHGGFMHIIGNMFFLYLFGNNVNDKLGHLGYVCFYLAGGVFAAIGHMIFSGSPVLGASGAVAAVTGAYLVLFPQSLVTVFYWLFFFIDTIDIPAIYFIGFKLIVWDNMIERTVANVAYDAHLSGYFFGILAVLILLSTKLLSPGQYDLWMMIKQWNRRRRYRDSVDKGRDPFTARVNAENVKKPKAKKVKTKEVKSESEKQKEKQIEEIRTKIAERTSQHNISEAANLFLQLMNIDEKQVLPKKTLIDIANQLASENKHNQAAAAYEQFLRHYENYEYVEQVQLMLGLIYSRYLGKPKKAEKQLKKALERLSDESQRKMAEDEIKKLKNK